MARILPAVVAAAGQSLNILAASTPPGGCTRGPVQAGRLDRAFPKTKRPLFLRLMTSCSGRARGSPIVDEPSSSGSHSSQQTRQTQQPGSEAGLSRIGSFASSLLSPGTSHPSSESHSGSSGPRRPYLDASSGSSAGHAQTSLSSRRYSSRSIPRSFATSSEQDDGATLPGGLN